MTLEEYLDHLVNDEYLDNIKKYNLKAKLIGDKLIPVPVTRWEQSGNVVVDTYDGYKSDDKDSVTVYIPNYATQLDLVNSVHLFQNCRKIKLVGGAGIRSYESAFSYFLYCEEYDLSEFRTDNAISLNNMFQGNYKVRYLDLRGLNFSNVESIRGMVSSCGSIQEVRFDGLNTSRLVDMGFIFSNCFSLERVSFRGLDLSSVKNMSSLCRKCCKLESIDFEDCGLESLKNLTSAFEGCTNLKELRIDGYKLSNIERLDRLCCNCTYLKLASFNKMTTSKVQGISSMFEGCYNLEELLIGDFVDDNMFMYTNAFRYCRSLKMLDLSKFRFAKDNSLDIRGMLVDVGRRETFRGMEKGADFLRNSFRDGKPVPGIKMPSVFWELPASTRISTTISR